MNFKQSSTILARYWGPEQLGLWTFASAFAALGNEYYGIG